MLRNSFLVALTAIGLTLFGAGACNTDTLAEQIKSKQSISNSLTAYLPSIGQARIIDLDEDNKIDAIQLVGEVNFRYVKKGYEHYAQNPRDIKYISSEMEAIGSGLLRDSAKLGYLMDSN
ncbi:hypothetical protein HOK51_04995 [Candidatus Woesearchaeota archaeon]|jgi:hypothetical protein|nr:hypothetical protein [Candidatus Woesearchaeota archaeon]MBT6519183.1 hypothetical protein [Candidatus Woesearchaeota archaeon]MBT7367659.1 hypothetical protein [Candidatus Woesearchaeota archaeon]